MAKIWGEKTICALQDSKCVCVLILDLYRPIETKLNSGQKISSCLSLQSDVLLHIICNRCGLDSRERKVTYFLFWGIIFFFVLIMLNALIAIMNNSYQTLQDTWHEQIKKTWVCKHAHSFMCEGISG
jgi:hypothetical protein